MLDECGLTRDVGPNDVMCQGNYPNASAAPAYQASACPLGYYRCVTWLDQNPYYCEDNLILTTQEY